MTFELVDGEPRAHFRKVVHDVSIWVSVEHLIGSSGRRPYLLRTTRLRYWVPIPGPYIPDRTYYLTIHVI